MVVACRMPRSGQRWLSNGILLVFGPQAPDQLKRIDLLHYHANGVSVLALLAAFAKTSCGKGGGGCLAYTTQESGGCVWPSNHGVAAKLYFCTLLRRLTELYLCHSII